MKNSNVAIPPLRLFILALAVWQLTKDLIATCKSEVLNLMNISKLFHPSLRGFVSCGLVVFALAVWGDATSQAKHAANAPVNSSPAPDINYTLTGHVYYLNGTPAANATVTMEGSSTGSTTTDAAGAFTFTLPPINCFDGSHAVIFHGSAPDPSCEPTHVRPDYCPFGLCAFLISCGGGGEHNVGSITLGGCTSSAPPSPTPTPTTVDDVRVPACPIPTPTPDDSTFVGTISPSQASTCTYHQPLTYDITANIPIDRVIGETDSDGRLVNAQALVQNSIVSEFATLKIASYDVDSGANNPPYAPEHDLVTINSEDPTSSAIGATTYLQGQDKKWIVNEYRVPISRIRFGKRGANGGPSTPANNAVSLQIDLGNSQNSPPNTKTRWCTTIAWASIHFDAMAPVIMVHGNNSSGRFWDRLGFTQPFRDKLIPYDNSIKMKTGTVEAHGELLAQTIPAIAKSFGAHNVHIIAHSKGGLDVRDFLARTLPAKFGVLSVTTLSTPHHGSVGADYAIDSSDPNVNWRLSEAPERALLARAAGVDAGTPDLRIVKVESFNRTNLPAIRNKTFTVDGITRPVAFFTFGADANLDGSHEDCTGQLPSQCTGEPTINYSTNPALNEIRGIEEGLGWGVRLLLNTPQKRAALFGEVYQLMGEVSSTKIGHRPGTGTAFVQEIHLCPHPLDCFQFNDFLVTMNSAKLPGWTPTELTGLTGANHATMSTPEVAQRVITQIQNVQVIR